MKNTKHLVILLCISCFSIKTNAQINYQDFIPDVVLDTWSSQNVHIDSAVTSVLSYGDPGNISIWQEFESRIVVNAFSECDVLMNGSHPAALDLNQPIDATGTWEQPDYDILNDGSQGNWMGVIDKYLGVRIKSGTQWLYGWIRMDVNAAGNSVTIKDYACNRVPDAAINAGQITPTGISDRSDVLNNLISIYPNPNSGNFNLDIEKISLPFQIIIMNSNGQIMYQKSDILSHSLDIELGKVSEGLYTVQVILEENVYNKKLLVK